MIREKALEEARRWIGTPFHHRASVRGSGCDCVGLIRGIWRELYGAEPLPCPDYPALPYLLGDQLDNGLSDWLAPAELPLPGDILTFCWRLNEPARHCAILSDDDHIIHAYWRRAVAETAMTPWWERRISRTFSFPERG